MNYTRVLRWFLLKEFKFETSALRETNVNCLQISVPVWLQLNSIYLSVDHSRLLFLMVFSVVRLVGTLLASRWLSTLVCSQGQDPFSHTSGHQVIFDEELQTCVVLLHLQTFLQNDHEVESTWHFYIFLMIFLSATQLNFFWSVISQQSLLLS